MKNGEEKELLKEGDAQKKSTEASSAGLSEFSDQPQGGGGSSGGENVPLLLSDTGVSSEEGEAESKGMLGGVIDGPLLFAERMRGADCWGGYQIAKISFVSVTSLISTTLFLKTSIDYAKTAPRFLQVVVPPSVIAVNFFGNILGADEAWHGFQKLHVSKVYTLGQKVRRSVWATLLGIIPSVSPIGTAVVEGGDSAVWQPFLIVGTICDALPSNFFSAFNVLSAVDECAHRCMPRAARWETTLSVKHKLIRLFEEACDALECYPEDAESIKAQMQEQDPRDRSRFFALSLVDSSQDVGRFNKWRERIRQPSEPSKKRRMLMLSSNVAAFLISLYTSGSWLGFSCSTQHFWNNYLKNEEAGWGLGMVSITPLFYLSGALTYTICQSMFNHLIRLYYREPVNLPLSLKAYPKTNIALGLLITLLGGFSWGTSIQLVNKHCPEEVIPSFKAILYGAVPISNIVQTVLAFNKMIRMGMQSWGKSDEKDAQYLISIIKHIISDLKNMSPSAFAEAILPDSSEELIKGIARNEEEKEIDEKKREEKVGFIVSDWKERIRSEQKVAQGRPVSEAEEALLSSPVRGR